MGQIYDRRIQTKARVEELQKRLTAAASLAAGKACVYATGSFGRGEASLHSDLDLFILGKGSGSVGDGSLLKRLDEICIKAELIKVTRDLGIQEFSGDGKYLAHYSVHNLTRTLGTPEDDSTNNFTARLLLLLESAPLFEGEVYQEAVDDVIAAYWRDYADHQDTFIPAFLANDILRLWRTFCVNYEARTERIPDYEKIKGKLKNYKLKHSRLLTCYSGLLYLLATYRQNNFVTPLDARDMSKKTPTQRLEWLRDQPTLGSARDIISELLDQYELFLETTNAEEGALIERFQDKIQSQNYMEAAYKFGDLVFKALNNIGNGNRFHRLLVV